MRNIFDKLLPDVIPLASQSLAGMALQLYPFNKTPHKDCGKAGNTRLFRFNII